MSPGELRQIEDLVNEKMRSDLPVQIYELRYDEAQKRSDIKQFFGEKYGEKVRVIDIDFSKELCGGTHTSRIGTIGYFKIAKESSIAAGVRRIEAVTGKYAEQFVQQEEDLIQSLSSLLKSPVQSLPEKLQSLLDENKLLTQELKSFRKGHLKQLLEKCLSHKEKFGIDRPRRRRSAGRRGRSRCVLPTICSISSNRASSHWEPPSARGASSLVAVSPDLVQKNINAQALIKEAAPFIQGGGGGKQNLAQAGGKDPLGLPKALEKIRHILKETKC